MTCQFQYSGNMINELYAMTDNVLDLARIKRELENKKICAKCGFPRGEHSHVASLCPTEIWYSTTEEFSEVRCDGPSGNGLHDPACGKECVPGEVYCREHSKEAS